MKESAKMIKRYVLNFNTLYDLGLLVDKWDALQYKAWRRYMDAINAHGGMSNITNVEYDRLNKQYYGAWRVVWERYFALSQIYRTACIAYKGRGKLYI